MAHISNLLADHVETTYTKARRGSQVVAEAQLVLLV